MFSSYGKTGHFKDIIKKVKERNNFIGLNENGEAMFENKPLPILTFEGTVKLHGTNAAIGYDLSNDNYWFQSRSNVVSQGHFGFPQSFTPEQIELIRSSIILFNDDKITFPNNYKLIVYGEYAGEGIQKGVAISQLNRTFYIFAAKLIKEDSEEYLSLPDDLFIATNPPQIVEYDNIKFVQKFAKYKLIIDFNNLTKTQEEIDKIVSQVEQECPVAAARGASGLGEGVVWVSEFKGQRLIFKTKGEKHSVVREKKKFDIDGEKLEKIKDFVDYSVTSARIEQAIFELNLTNPTNKDTGNILKWINKDIASEEVDTLLELGLDWYDVSPYINREAAKMYLEKINV